MSKKKVLIIFGLIGLVALLFLRGYLTKKRIIPIPPRPVQTAIAIQKDVPVYIEGFGNLNPLMNVDIKAQVTGKLLEYHFTEGKKVAKGDLLFTIDPSEYKAELDRANAALVSDQVDLKLKIDTLNRNKQLITKNLISQQDYEKYETDVDAAESRINLDKATVELAKINLDYCYIKSPVDGQAGHRQVDPGNIILENNGPTLVNIKTINTLYVDFTVSDKDLARVRKAMAENVLKVEVVVEGDEKNVYSGELKLIENAVDNKTGTIFLRAIVNNENNALWAGQFVFVHLILGIHNMATLVPYEAVQLGQKGSYLFAVTPDNKADMRIVTTGNKQDSWIVVDSGVTVGDKVVTQGQLGLSPGVSIVDLSQASAAAVKSEQTKPAQVTSPEK